jgi:hypothetical protein
MHIQKISFITVIVYTITVIIACADGFMDCKFFFDIYELLLQSNLFYIISIVLISVNLLNQRKNKELYRKFWRKFSVLLLISFFFNFNFFFIYRFFAYF